MPFEQFGGLIIGLLFVFILLIIAGYIAGIAAKLINHKFNYVLVVYIINLVIVSLNIVVYFVNRKRDRQLSSQSK